MPKVEPLKILSIDNVPHLVEQMSDNVRELVSIANDWREREAEARSELQLVQAGLRDIFRQITATIQQERDAAAKKAAVEQPKLEVVEADQDVADGQPSNE